MNQIICDNIPQLRRYQLTFRRYFEASIIDVDAGRQQSDCHEQHDTRPVGHDHPVDTARHAITATIVNVLVCLFVCLERAHTRMHAEHVIANMRSARRISNSLGGAQVYRHF